MRVTKADALPQRETPELTALNLDACGMGRFREGIQAKFRWSLLISGRHRFIRSPREPSGRWLLHQGEHPTALPLTQARFASRIPRPLIPSALKRVR